MKLLSYMLTTQSEPKKSPCKNGFSNMDRNIRKQMFSIAPVNGVLPVRLTNGQPVANVNPFIWAEKFSAHFLLNFTIDKWKPV